jgi:hypothetical protein
MQDKRNLPDAQKARDSDDFEPLGKLYDDPREHGSADTQRADEGSKARDDAGNKREEKHNDNAAGSPTRANSSEEFPGAGHGNG